MSCCNGVSSQWGGDVWQLIDEEERLEFKLRIDGFNDLRIVQARSCRVDVLSVRGVPHDEELGFMSVPDVEGEIDLRYHPVEHRGGHVRVRDLC